MVDRSNDGSWRGAQWQREQERTMPQIPLRGFDAVDRDENRDAGAGRRPAKSNDSASI
ncbi:hypothetical protein [Burkholderia sp. 567]|uniref:hypothetical protein n=1 Tax=Burkholderia sp. 567 TaxID=3156413 RepID=UPI0033940A36